MRFDLPAPKFQSLERVRIAAHNPRLQAIQGESGTIYWNDSFYLAKQPDRWMYIVYLPGRKCWPTFFEGDLESEGTFNTEAALASDRPEISFDTVMEDDMRIVEGCFRLPGEPWQVMGFGNDDVSTITCKTTTWPRVTPWEPQASGLAVTVPENVPINRTFVLRTMSEVTGVGDWVEVRGPDSMNLR